MRFVGLSYHNKLHLRLRSSARELREDDFASEKEVVTMMILSSCPMTNKLLKIMKWNKLVLFY